MTITVYGMPGPQGSKKFVGMSKAGRGILVESSAKVKPWRQDVISAAKEVMSETELTVDHHCNGAVPGALRVSMTFTLPKPKSAPKSRVTFPDRKPDLSKLIRSTEDALTDAGAWEDDARVVELTAAKRYPNEGTDALSSPGCVIRIEKLG